MGSSEKRCFQLLKNALIAVSEENESLQNMYNSQMQMIESFSSKLSPQNNNNNDDIKFLEEENQILQASVDETEAENKKLRAQIESQSGTFGEKSSEIHDL